MKKKYLGRKMISCMLAAGMVLSMTACGGKNTSKAEPGVANTDTVSYTHLRAHET